jgi:hypothetical protein
VQAGYYSSKAWNANGVIPVGPIPAIEELGEGEKAEWNEDGWKGFDEKSA